MAASSTTFTPRELELQALAWQCFDGEPKVNFQKLAELAGMSNPVSVSNAWAKIKKKLAAQAGAVGAPKSPEKAAATPGKRKKKAEGEGEDDEESPAKKAKPTPKKGGRKKKVDEVMEEEDGEVGDEGAKVKGEEDEDVF